MPKGLTSEERKARRAEINRENAKKSTGPKSIAGKMVVRLNGLKHGQRSRIIDLSGIESLELLPSECPKTYQSVVAHFADKIQPRDEVELGISQRLADLQWRLLRLQRNERIFNEECLIQASQMAHVGVSENRLGDLDSMNGFRVGLETKTIKEFRREELAILQARAMTYRELETLRKLDPLPKTPLTRQAPVLGPTQAASVLENRNQTPDQKVQPDDLIKKTAEAPNDQSQPLTGWNFSGVRVPRRAVEPAPKTMAAGAPLGVPSGAAVEFASPPNDQSQSPAGHLSRRSIEGAAKTMAAGVPLDFL